MTLDLNVYGQCRKISILLADYLANNLYWIDYEKATIEVFSLNTKRRAIIQHYAGTDKPTALALAPSKGEMFVALESSDHFHIDKQSMRGGEDHRHIVEDGLTRKGPIHLAADESTELLYWSDGDGKKIEVSDFNGMKRRMFVTSKKSPGPMAIINEELYWTSLKSKTLQWRNKFGATGTKMVSLDMPPSLSSKPNLISVVAGAPLKTVNHPCKENNGGCSDICLSDGPSSRVCMCVTGHVFKDSTNTTCLKRSSCDFRCSTSGECLEASQKCNGKVECLDKSDETDCTKDESKCAATEFKCRSGNQCIPVGQRCDSHFNCDDRSDEVDCTEVEKKEHCKSTEMRCPSGFCVDVTQRCDGHDDCGDGFDERSDLCKSTDCPRGFFKCLSGQCLPKEFECNAYIDCKDASDEHAECRKS